MSSDMTKRKGSERVLCSKETSVQLFYRHCCKKEGFAHRTSGCPVLTDITARRRGFHHRTSGCPLLYSAKDLRNLEDNILKEATVMVVLHSGDLILGTISVWCAVCRRAVWCLASSRYSVWCLGVLSKVLNGNCIGC